MSPPQDYVSIYNHENTRERKHFCCFVSLASPHRSKESSAPSDCAGIQKLKCGARTSTTSIDATDNDFQKPFKHLQTSLPISDVKTEKPPPMRERVSARLTALDPDRGTGRRLTQSSQRLHNQSRGQHWPTLAVRCLY